jgi:transaldolase
VTILHDLYRQTGQSPWLDNLRRSALASGDLARRVDQGIRGVTSNPTIFQKSVSGGDDYDEQFQDLLATNSVEEAYWELALTDVARALTLLRPVHDESGGADGFVSIEVAPSMAHDAESTVRAVRWLHGRLASPNALVKVPATAEGVDAIRRAVSEGHSINVTLIFGLERYAEVIEAYLSGLEAYGGDLSGVHGVASFFLSRVDTEVDRRLEAAGTAEAEALRGTAAVAQAKLAYRLFRERFSGPRWEALAARGARLQRPLWASTSTKNPAYSDLLYVEPLMGPDTVNTMPEETIAALLDHGRVATRIEEGADEARTTLDRLDQAGVDLAAVAAKLERDGVASFAASFDGLMQALTEKAAALTRTG